MSKAILINDPFTEYKCNICSEIIEKGKIIGLKCNFKKHIFCYSCIYDWYKEISYNSLYTKQMCPICRKKGGALPHLSDVPFHKHVHYFPENHIFIQNCGCQLKNKKTTCFVIGKPENNFKCVRHLPKLKKEEQQDVQKSVEVK